MGSKRRVFSPEFRDEAVKLVINTGRPVAVVAREIGVSDKALGRWVNEYRGRLEMAGGPLSESERAELVRLRRENSELSWWTRPAAQLKTPIACAKG
jgi:transposase